MNLFEIFMKKQFTSVQNSLFSDKIMLECDLEPVILGQLELNEELHRKYSERAKKAAETRKINKEKKRIQDDFNDKRWIGELF